MTQAMPNCDSSPLVILIFFLLILDQKLEAQDRQAKIVGATKDIAALHSQLKGKGTSA